MVEDSAYGQFDATANIIVLDGSWRLLCKFAQDASFDDSLTRIAYFTNHHEQQHLNDAFTTPFGLLCWRIESAIRNDATWLASKHGWPGPDKKISTQVLISLRNSWPEGNLNDIREVAYRRRVARELDTLMEFRSALWTGPSPNLTIGEFVDLANETLSILRARYDLHTSWRFTTNAVDEDQPALIKTQDHSLSGWCAVDIIERSATLCERFAAGLAQVDGWWFDWRKPRMQFRDVDGFSGELNAVRMMAWRRLLDSCLSGPCDPALPLDVNVPVEYAFPQWRWLTGRQQYLADPSRLSEPALLGMEPVPATDGLPDSDTVRQLLARTPLDGPRGMFWDATINCRGAHVTDSRRSYPAFILSRFEEAFALPLLGRPTSRLEPLITIYNDFYKVARVAVSNVPLSSDEITSLCRSFRAHYAYLYTGKAVAYGIPLNIGKLWDALYQIGLRIESIQSSANPQKQGESSRFEAALIFRELCRAGLVDPEILPEGYRVSRNQSGAVRKAR